MKPTLFKLLSVLLFTFSLLCFSCEKSGEYDAAPGISVYKTNGDYYELVTVGMKGDDIFRTWGFFLDFGKPICNLLVTDTDTIYKSRKKLVNGYVLDREADERYDVFLSLSFKEYLKMEQRYNTFTIPDDTLKKYILDKDPYTEFYRNKTNVKDFQISDSLEINRIIENDSLDYYFKKVI